MPSGWEWAILVLIALLLFGGAWLPGVGRSAGRAVRSVTDSVSSAGAPVEPARNDLDAPAPAEFVAASPSDPERD